MTEVPIIDKLVHWCALQINAGEGEGEGGASKIYTIAYKWRGATSHVYVLTFTISFHVLGSMFVLRCLVFFVKI